jgi:hypothetical protein
MFAAKYLTIMLNAVADNTTIAVSANRCQRLDRAFEGIENGFPAVHGDRERFGVIISANGADTHNVNSASVNSHNANEVPLRNM